jgi:hypothetical protein
MPFRCIISDIDGCLGPESHAPLDAEALLRVAAWNRAAQARGTSLTLCSGRPQPYAEAMSRLIGNVSCPIICEMGVWLYDPRDNRFLMDPAITREDLSVIDACTSYVRAELMPLGVIMQPGKAASISLWHPNTPTLMGMRDAICDRCQREGWNLRVSNTVAWINLELAHVSKGSGIERLCAMMGFAKHDLAGIGDTRGDMAIRERVAWFACPSNAEAELKAKADYVSPHAEVHGVLDVLARIDSKL